ncbi:peptidoglycan-binding domain-containing protein [Rheinheimera sp.]|uniref:peptidoglycan-binding domain-containing protein n=1 Tax=Rheinheimera sp. TaxID=1869214 RepID=UPI00307E16B5
MPFPAHVQKELQFPGAVTLGQKGSSVKKLQEWLSLQQFGCEPDGIFGKATLSCLQRFQQKQLLPASQSLTETCWQKLTAPMQQALTLSPAAPHLSTTVMRVARQHLEQHPMEVGGDNKGPWVRLYMQGNEGTAWYWCAGFVTFILKQACLIQQQKMPIPGSFSCDSLASQAKTAGLFLPEKQASNIKPDQVFIFLNRKSASDWTHTGLGFAMQDGVFQTIEGNTNNDGSRNGYEVCQRTRTVKSKDFVMLG